MLKDFCIPEIKQFDSYEDMVNDYACNKVNQLIPNSVSDHAATLIAAMFKHGQKRVDIFCQKLSDNVYKDNPNVARNALSFARKGGCIRIMLEDNLADGLFDKPLIYKLITEINSAKQKQKPTGSLEIKHLDKNDEAHFCIMDDAAYRLEYDKKNTKAHANFNDPVAVKQLDEKFSKLFTQSKPLFAI